MVDQQVAGTKDGIAVIKGYVNQPAGKSRSIGIGSIFPLR